MTVTNYLDDFTSEQIDQYVSQARGIVAALDEYEEAHPKGAPCFADLLDALKARVGA